MYKTFLFILLLGLLFSCNNKPEYPKGDIGKSYRMDTTLAPIQPGTITLPPGARSMARAAAPIIDSTRLTPNGDTLVYGHTVETGTYTYDKNFVIFKSKVTTPPVNTPPVARAGADQVLTLPTNSTKLDGTATTDAENNIKSYGWRKTSGTGGTITDSNKAICTVSGLTKGVYTYELRVADNANAFTVDFVTVTVNDPVVVPGTPVLFSFTQLPVGDPDLNRPQAGAEQWHDRNDVALGYTPQDVYYRFVATRIATATRGQYNWSYLDGLINAAIARKQKLSFGIMTSYPEGTTSNGLVQIGNGTASYPTWLQSAMNGEWLINGTWVPNYNDPVYLAWLLELNQAIYKHLNETVVNGIRYKDVINSIDIRSYGTWGEWHSCCIAENFTVDQYPAGTFPTAASLKKIVDAYTQGFPDIQLTCMIAAFDANWLNNTRNPPEIAWYVLTQRNQKGMIGWRRDQWGATDSYLSAYLENNTRSFNGLVFRDSIMTRWRTAPITGEPPSWIPNDYADLERQIKLYKATSFGNGNYGTNTPNAVIQARVKAASKAAGYRLVSTGGEFTPGATSISIKINWQNIGQCPTYDDWNITYEVVNSSGQVTTLGVSAFKLRLFLPSNTQTTVTDVFPLNLPAGTYTLRVVVKDATGFRAPAYLNIQGRNSDGSYNIKQFTR